ncbi:transporter substrate-binding domain-containing protein [Streptomyces sp. NPDC059477]|uniref:transporter substrate-binding domain-containing protein n=1 Tax=Streptomyces sp. NPDC059477 TaxID=3346847 RepID=UPI0036900431
MSGSTVGAGTDSVRVRATARGRALAIALAVVLVGTSAAACGDPDPTFLGRSRITIAHKNDQPGTSYKPDYNYSGFDYLLGTRILDELGLKDPSRPIDVPSEERVTAITTREADLVIATFSITEERMAEIDFVGPYAITYQGFIVGKDGGDIHTVEDLDGRSVCTWKGTTSEQVLARPAYEDIDLDVLGDASDCFDELREGRSDAVSTDQLILYGFADHYADEGLRVLPGQTVGPPQYYGIGMPKGYREDCERLREIVKRYVDSSDWLADIKETLRLIPENETDWQTQYRPSAAAIDSRSCRDSPSP